SFNNYPASPVKSWTKAPPGAGSSFSVFMWPYFQPSTPHDQNPTWQEVEKQLNAKVSFQLYGGTDYAAKLATTMAGNDLPDVIHLRGGYTAAPNLPAFFKAK